MISTKYIERYSQLLYIHTYKKETHIYIYMLLYFSCHVMPLTFGSNYFNVSAPNGVWRFCLSTNTCTHMLLGIYVHI